MSDGLTIAVDSKELKISLSLDVLKMAAESHDAFSVEDQQVFSVRDPEEFANSVKWALEVEDEDGSTRVTRMFDSAFEHLIDQGELAGLNYPAEYDE